MNDSRLLTRLAREGDFDCFLMAGRYTLLDQTALADLLPLAQERGIAIYIGGPFNSAPTFSVTFDIINHYNTLQVPLINVPYGSVRPCSDGEVLAGSGGDQTG